MSAGTLRAAGRGGAALSRLSLGSLSAPQAPLTGIVSDRAAFWELKCPDIAERREGLEGEGEGEGLKEWGFIFIAMLFSHHQ